MTDVLERAELVFGLVGSIGTDLAGVVEQLAEALGSVGYGHEEIRLSGLLRSLPGETFSGLPEHGSVPEEEWYSSHIHAGNELRRIIGRQDAVALLGMAHMRTLRKAAGGTADAPRQQHAYILRSLKTPEEVDILRGVYRSRFILISAYDTDVRKEASLASRIASSHNSMDNERWRADARKLMTIDEDEAHGEGQHVRDTFHRADFFVDCSQGEATRGRSIERFVHLLFSSPEFTPSIDELAMFHAFAASLRSGSLARQVGAAIVDDDGAVVATGTNEVAKAFGGQYWEADSDEIDERDITRKVDSVNLFQRVLLGDALEKLREEGWLADKLKDKSINDLLGDVLYGDARETIGRARIFALLEFGRAVHAEMAAITDAARRGVSIKNTTLVSTTFPCHECARHVVASGVKRVLFIEPYPKSLVRQLFDDSITMDERDDTKVRFLPFRGVAPPIFVRVYRAEGRKSKDGRMLPWVAHESMPRVNPADLPYSAPMERELVIQLEAISGPVASSGGAGDEGKPAGQQDGDQQRA